MNKRKAVIDLIINCIFFCSYILWYWFSIFFLENAISISAEVLYGT